MMPYENGARVRNTQSVTVNIGDCTLAQTKILTDEWLVYNFIIMGFITIL